MTLPADSALGARLRDLRERLDRSPALLSGAAAGEVGAALRAAEAAATEWESRERVYRETTRRLNNDFERKVLELSVLRQIGDLIAGSLKVDDLLVRLLDVLVREFRVDNTSVMLLDPATGDLTVEAGRGVADDDEDAARPPSPVLHLGEGIAGWVAASGEALLVNDTSRDVRFQSAGAAPVRGSLVCVPLLSEERVCGVLNVSSANAGAFDQHHLHILRIVASQIAAALTGNQLFRELEHLSTRLEEEVSQRTGELEARTADLRRKNDQVTQLYFSLERAQAELEQRNRRLVETLTFNDNIVETVNVGISVVDQAGRVLTWNRAMDKLTDGRLPKERMLGRRLTEIPDDLREAFTLGEVLERVIRDADPVTIHDHLVESPSGGRLHLNIHHLPVAISNEGGSHVITVIHDITDNVGLHEQKVRSERLAAINETMVGVNHEVNNPLAVILGYAQMMLAKVPSGADGDLEKWRDVIVRDLERIESEALRIGEITRKLSSLVEPVVTLYPASGGARMLDVHQSQ